jgi:hypothetical protein
VQQTTQNDTSTTLRAMRVRILGGTEEPSVPKAAQRWRLNRNTVTSVITLLVAAVFAVGATTALAASGRNAEKETIELVREHQPKLERKDRWERKAIDLDFMWRR